MSTTRRKFLKTSVAMSVAESGTGKSLVLGELDRPLREKKKSLLEEFKETERRVNNQIEIKKSRPEEARGQNCQTRGKLERRRRS